MNYSAEQYKAACMRITKLGSKKCSVTGCKNEAINVVTSLYGDREKRLCCASCSPNVNNRPDFMKNLPVFYTVEPIK